MFILVRTDFDAPKHNGISFMLLTMDQPGVTTKPIRLISGFLTLLPRPFWTTPSPARRTWWVSSIRAGRWVSACFSSSVPASAA